MDDGSHMEAHQVTFRVSGRTASAIETEALQHARQFFGTLTVRAWRDG